MNSLIGHLHAALIASLVAGHVAAQSPYEWVRVVGFSPPADNTWQLGYDSGQSAVIAARLGGGANTWMWNGHVWTETSLPYPRDSRGIVYHPALGASYCVQQTASFEPMITFALIPDVGWVGVDSDGPTTRSRIAWAYDSARGKSVLFGGSYALQQAEPAYTWEWDGFDWEVHDTLTSGPPRRISSAMAYDAKRGEVVLYGGALSISAVDPLFSDTWTWNGQTWTQKQVNGPGPRAYHGMIYDPVREKVLLFGGSHDNGSYLGDLWEWDGTSWSQIPLTGPPGRIRPGFTYDAARGEGVLYSGLRRNSEGQVVPLPDTWRLRVRETWVDFNHNGSETGTFSQPFNTLAEAVQAATADTIVNIKPGSTTEVITISKPLRIHAPLGTVTIGSQ